MSSVDDGFDDRERFRERSSLEKSRRVEFGVVEMGDGDE
jgi:hypothetical protein